MEKHKIRIPVKDKIKIIPVGDIHAGGQNTSWGKFYSFLKWAEQEEDLYIIGMGDWLDSILAEDKRYSADDKAVPILKIMADIERLLRPLADKGKIIGLHMGNHERKLKKQGFGCPIEELCRRFGCKYLGYSSYVQIVAEHTNRTRNTLTIFAHHGWFSGRKRGAKVNNMEDVSSSWDADLYLFGHSHDMISTKRVFITYHGQRERAFVNTGTFSKTVNGPGTTSYSEMAGYPPQKIGIVRVEWEPWRQSRVAHGKQKGDLHIID